MATIRMCLPASYGMFYDFQSDGTVTGVSADSVREINSFITQGTNASLILRSQNDGLGRLIDEKTGAYDGCIGLVQRNQSDIVYQVTEYPHPAENVYQGQVLTDSFIQFFGYYTARQEVDSVQLESCFGSFDNLVWLLCLLLSVVFALAFVLQRWLVSQNLILLTPENVVQVETPLRSIFFQVVAHMASRGELKLTEGVFAKLMYSTVSLFSFLVLFHFCSFIKTELVAIRPPVTLRSYRDLIDHRVGLAVYEGFDTLKCFANGTQGSEERQLWDLTKAKYPNGENVMKAKTTPLVWLTDQFVRQQIVLVVDSYYSPTLMRYVCRNVVDKERVAFANHLGSFQFKEKTIFPLIGQDERAPVTLRIVILNESAGNSLMQKLRKTFTRMREGGILWKICDTAAHIDIIAKLFNLPERLVSAGLIEECVQNILYSPDIAVNGIKLINMRNFFGILFVLFSISLIFLLLEIISHSITRKSHVEYAYGISARR